MIQQERDYIMRWIQKFFMALDRLINGSNEYNDERYELEINNILSMFFEKEKDFFIHASMNDILRFLNKDKDSIKKINPLCTILYYAAVREKDQNTKTTILKKIKDLIAYHQKTTKTIAVETIHFLSKIDSLLEKS